jgi:flagellar biosynthesis protein FlhA
MLAALALLLAPVPAPVLDLLLALNLALALGLLLVTVLHGNGQRPSSLPGWLVLTSLARIALAVGAARAVFAGNPAGSLVVALGSQMTSGGENLIGGTVMAAILAIVAFMVIGLGVMRLAEVGARFALDALPGRQMALDSALTAGRTDAAAGLAKAVELDATNAFYGAMDGAARFLRADVTVCVVVSALLPLAAFNGKAGGLAPALASAVSLATLLLVGAILSGAAAAVSLTSSSGTEEGARDLQEQLLSPAAAGIVAVVLLVVALMPGMAKLPLIVVGGMAATGAWVAHRSRGRKTPAAEAAGGVQLQVRLGLGLISLTTAYELPAFLAKLRTRLADELGFALPPISVTDDATMPTNDFTLCLDGLPVTQGTLRAGRQLVMTAGEGALPAGGSETMLPNGAQATWLRESEFESLPSGQYHLLQPLEVLALYLQETLWAHAAHLFDLQRATEWLAAVEMTHPASVAALARAGLGTAEVQQVGRGLLAEGLPLRERVSLVEALARAGKSDGGAGYHPAQANGGPDIRPLQTADGVPDDLRPLIEAVRPALARTITEQVAVEGVAEVIELGAEVEQALLDQVEQTGAALPPEQARQWAETLLWLADLFSRPQRPAALLCHPQLRPVLARQIRDCGANLRAITATDLLPLTQLRCKHYIGTLQQQPMMRPQTPEV